MTIHWPASTDIRRPVKRAKRSQPAKRAAPERAIQVAIVKALHKYAKDCVWYAVPNGGHRHIFTASKLKAEGTKRGTPDLCFVLPGGRAAFLELKAEKGRLSDEQKEFCRAVTALQGWWAVAHSTDEAWGVLAGWGVLPSTINQDVLD